MRTVVIALWFLAVACDQGKSPAVDNKPPAEAKRAPGDAGLATTEDCDQLLAHLVDLEFATASGAASTETMRTELAKQKSSVSAARRDEFMRACVGLPRDQVTCATAGADLRAVAKCDEPPGYRR